MCLAQSLGYICIQDTWSHDNTRASAWVSLLSLCTVCVVSNSLPVSVPPESPLLQLRNTCLLFVGHAEKKNTPVNQC